MADPSPTIRPECGNVTKPPSADHNFRKNFLSHKIKAESPIRPAPERLPLTSGRTIRLEEGCEKVARGAAPNGSNRTRRNKSSRCNHRIPNSETILSNLLMETEKQVELGSWLGLQRAFATVAGSCSAARAQCLKQVRESKVLDEAGLNWEEFCTEYAGISRPHADSLIRQYEQFGDAYFRLSEIARVSPQTYGKIAPHVDGDTIEIDGVKLALTPENAHKIRAAIQSLRSQVRRPPTPARPPAAIVELQIRVDALAEDIGKAVRALSCSDERPAFHALSTYAMNKFRGLARQLEGEVSP